MIAGVDALLLSVFAVIVVIVLVCVLVGKFIMYAFGRLRGSGGMTAILGALVLLASSQ